MDSITIKINPTDTICYSYFSVSTKYGKVNITGSNSFDCSDGMVKY